MKDLRFQYAPRFIQLWRLRYLVWLPLIFAYGLLVLRLSKKQAWIRAVDLVRYKMDWIYDWQVLYPATQDDQQTRLSA